MTETNLILDVPGLPPESARNCVQELTPITNGEFKKSINGDLLFLETTVRRCYRSVISCKDINSAICDGLWIGTQLSVGCIQNLWQTIQPSQTEIRLIRHPVEGSVCVLNNFGEHIKFELADCTVKLQAPSEQKLFVCFRPWMTMRVVDFSIETDEWGMRGGWKLILEEV